MNSYVLNVKVKEKLIDKVMSRDHEREEGVMQLSREKEL